ncbi:hypothetical protein QDR37_04805 [Amnibacterium sp. CER49]|uniref:hypothetical protein n=1 Tax=Amnibacterium sp. CER49 TaxID=3039161 RepID=UPI00244BC297|nr:hypothetical protein [Amnibacterium sp. CER49]MDH2443261.1 hypothetical protein [Amnibacterium sp. CER49]
MSGDPAVLAEVRRRYRGRGDAADQLWWPSHPGQDGPSGAPDPAAALHAARANLYRRGATREQAAALTAEQELLSADRRLAHEALLEALEARGRPSARDGGSGGSARAASRPTRMALTVLAGISLLAAGYLVGRAAERPAPPAVASTARAYRVLERPQEAPDRIPDTVRPRFVRSASTRLLATYGSIGTEVFGARADDGRLCLLVIVLGAKPTGTCTTESGFSAAGLFVEFAAGADPVNDSGLRPSDQIGLLWLADGTLTISV